MPKKTLLIVLSGLVAAISVVMTISAGQSRPTAPPESTYSYSLEDVYRRLDTGEVVTKTVFTEPTLGPAFPTGHTLEELFDLVGERSPVPRTWQYTCWNSAGTEIDCEGTGQDGEYQKGAFWPVPRFSDNDDGTVTDRLTGLVWLEDAGCNTFFSGDDTAANRRPWDDALTAANSLSTGYCGLSDGSSAGDWRLPNVRETLSLIDYSQTGPALPSGHPFDNIQTLNWGYWSSTTPPSATHAAWVIYVASGGTQVVVKIDPSGYVWAVRDGGEE
jgi:hypothetical protein